MLHAKIEALQEHKQQNGNDQRIFELYQRTIKSLEESNDRKDKKIAELEEWITIHWPLILNAGVMIKDLPSTVKTGGSLAALRQRMETLLDLEEIKQLCFDLDINYESLEGSTIDSKVRDLLTEVKRRERTEEVYSWLEKIRPDANWRELT